MKAILNKFKYQLLLLLISLILISFLSFLLQLNVQTFVYADSENYLESIKNLFLFHRGHPYRPILMAFINGIPYLLYNSDQFIFKWSCFVNWICWFSTQLLLFSLLKEFLKPKIAFYFTLSFAFCLGFTIINFHLLAESIFTFFLMLFLFFLNKYYKTERFKWLAYALSILILSMLVKPASKFIAIIIVLCFLKMLFLNYKQKVMALLYLSIFAVLVQVFGIKHQFGNYTISYIDVVTIHNYIGSKAKCIEKGIIYSQENNPRADYLFQFKVFQQNEIAKRDFKEQLLTNKINLFKAYIDNLKSNVSHGSSAIIDCVNEEKVTSFETTKKIIYLISAGQNLLLSLVGFILGIYFVLKNRKANAFFAYVGFLMFYIILVSGISCGQGDRFSIVIYPFCILLIAKFLQDIKLFSAPLQK